MKKTIFTLMLATVAFVATNTAQAQIQKGYVMVGGDIANLSLSLNSGGNTSFTLNPKAGWFIKDRLLIGTELLFGVSHTRGADGNTINYGLGGFGRYYISDKNVEVVRHSMFFFEGSLGARGQNVTSGGPSTNGLGFGFGPGWTYFVTPNIGIEALVKYNGVVGFGSEAYQHNLGVNLGFQIYLASKKLKQKVNQDFSKN